MKPLTIEDYVSHKKILTADEVRELPVGTVIQLHSLDRQGNHQWAPMTVVRCGKRKVLRSRDWRELGVIKPITTRSNMRYTEV